MFCAYTRPRYQVSVYRTIGPLLFFLKDLIETVMIFISSEQKALLWGAGLQYWLKLYFLFQPEAPIDIP